MSNHFPDATKMVTPRTDAKSFFYGIFSHPQNQEYVRAAFARQLERELLECVAERDKWSGIAGQLHSALMEIETVSDNGIRSGHCQCVECRVCRIANDALKPNAEATESHEGGERDRK